MTCIICNTNHRECQDHPFTPPTWGKHGNRLVQCDSVSRPHTYALCDATEGHKNPAFLDPLPLVESDELIAYQQKLQAIDWANIDCLHCGEAVYLMRGGVWFHRKNSQNSCGSDCDLTATPDLEKAVKRHSPQKGKP